MTREEIVGGLKLLEDNMVYFDELLNDKGKWIDVHELLFESIETLEQEPTTKENLVVEDCISRAELLKAVDTWDRFGCDAGSSKLVPIKDCYVPYIHYDDVVKAIKGMPSIRPKTEWISVGKRLPKSAGIYRVTRCYPNNVILVDACYFDGSNTWYNDNRINHARGYVDNIIAWQENPEPYKPTDSEMATEFLAEARGCAESEE